ncbi:MAG: FHA domain-containing protein [Anaerolineae bacterium]|nr:FHA domain-containing protein [Phycisphaerae bacterium]
MRRPLDGPTIVGRALDCPIWLDDNRLSRQHCRFEPSPDGGAESWSVIDLNSKNGTIVRGDRISAYKLADGDEVHVGRARLLFHSRSEPPQRPSAPTAPPSGPASTKKPAPSPADTLVDSRFPIPQIKPEIDVTKSSGEKTKSQRPLPFQRPPARPKVDASRLTLFKRRLLYSVQQLRLRWKRRRSK